MQTRNTKTKKHIIQIFKETPIPLTLNELYLTVKKLFPTTAYSTVFRTVKKLKKEERLVSLDFGGRGGRYEWAERIHHHHLICNLCGRITDVDDKTLNFKTDRIADITRFIIEYHAIELSGICKTCQFK